MGGTVKKEYLPLDGKPVLQHSLEAFGETGLFSVFVVTVPPGGEAEARSVLQGWLNEGENAKNVLFVEGAETRQKSVFRGLAALEGRDIGIVLIHDGARPWISPRSISEVFLGTEAYGACVPTAPAVDAMKEVGPEGFIERHLERKKTFGVQTPQGFLYSEILAAHRQAENDGRDYIDDTEIYAAYSGSVHTVAGEVSNKKITFAPDIPDNAGIPGNAGSRRTALPRIGFGYDLHRLVEGRPLLLGGVRLDFPLGEAGHSDGDVLIHAVIDALFGAAGLEDIGSHFPPSDIAYKDISSRLILRRTAELLASEGWHLGNIDCTVVLEKPKILPYRGRIIANLAEDLVADMRLITVKGKTKETVDAVGKGLAVEAFASALLYR
jgi:2-C-methyl-D-erythritol 4-phosphate cytidylyltransferase/2-C-methyl-D-erythritol 2,4-cyclodiphosphate synthase